MLEKAEDPYKTFLSYMNTPLGEVTATHSNANEQTLDNLDSSD